MRVLLVHNYYGASAPSGENRVFALEKALLESRGHELALFERTSDEIRQSGMVGTLRGALATPWNPFAARAMRRMIKSFRPQIVHAHNTFPLISPSVFSAARGAARVLTLHNYRLFCPAAIPMREGRVCTECLDQRSAGPAMLHGCYRDSRIATLPLAASVAFHRLRGTWRRDVDAFIALTHFQRDQLVAAGLPNQRVFVKPNFLFNAPPIVPWPKRLPRAVYAGRLSAEKGISDLISAWLSWGRDAPELVIAGDGPLRQQLESLAMSRKTCSIRFLGLVDPEVTRRLIGESMLAIVPSRWFEGLPVSIIEAFASGTPALVSSCGSLPDLVGDKAGAVFSAGNPQELRDAAIGLWKRPDSLEAMGIAALDVFKTYYTADATYKTLLKIYQNAMARAGVKPD